LTNAVIRLIIDFAQYAGVAEKMFSRRSYAGVAELADVQDLGVVTSVND